MDIYVVETGALSFEDIEGYLSCVSPARRKAVMKKASDSDKVQSLIGGLLLRSELSKLTGLPLRKISFVRGAHGKPYLYGGDAQFSLSHTKGAVCAAVAPVEAGEIGVDIELRDRKASDRLKERVLSDGESAVVKTDEDFIRVWVRKESFLKRIGIGVSTDLKGADTAFLPDTADFPCGAYRIGASGKGAAAAEIHIISAEELLSRFTPKSK